MNLFKRGAAIILMLLLLAGTAQAAITNVAIVTNLSSSDRIQTGVNGTFNITFTESLAYENMNIQFPAGFAVGGVVNTTDILTNLGAGNVAYTINGQWINLTNTTSTANGSSYVNFTANVTSAATSGTFVFTLQTNASTTTENIGTVNLYVRDATKPFYVESNNTNFTVGTETFGTLTTTIPLTGTGSANLTFYAPNITTQTNITVGWSATNASVLRANRTGMQTIIYVEVNPSVANPIITVSAPNDLESGNLPAIITATAISGVVVVYAYLRRRRRH